MVKRSAEGGERTEGGGGIEKAGWYMFVVDTATETDQKAELKCQVVAGEHESEIHRKQTHYVNFYGADEQKQITVNKVMFNWAEALGLEEKITGRIFTPDVRVEMVKSNAEVEFDFNEASGHAFIAKVDLEKYVHRPYTGNDAKKREESESKKAKYEGKFFPKINSFEVYHPLHDKVKDVPKDPEWMSIYGGGIPTQQQTAPQSPQTSSAPAPQPASAAAGGNGSGGDPWAVF